nr:MFS transporter [Nesterenkonia salmonea]
MSRSSGRSRPSTTRWLWLLVAVAVLSQAAIHLIRPTTTYKLIDLGADGMTVGLVTALYSLLPVLFALATASRAQRASSLRPLLLLGTALMSLGAAGTAAAPHVAGIAAASALLGVGQIVVVIAGQAAIARFAGNDQLDFAFGWFTAGFAAGQMVGPLVAGAILDPAAGAAGATLAIDRTLWWGTSLTGIIAVLLLISGRTFHSHRRADDSVLPSSQVPHQGGISHAVQIIRTPRVKSHFFASIALIGMMDLLAAFLPLVGDEAGISPLWVGVLLAARAAASMLSRVLLPLLRRWFSRHVLVVTALWGAGSMLGASTSVTQYFPWALLTIALGGFFLGLGQPLTMSAIAEAVPLHCRSSALALSLVGNRVGQVLVPMAAGGLTGVVGASGGVWLGCLLLLGSGVEKTVFWKK